MTQNVDAVRDTHLRRLCTFTRELALFMPIDISSSEGHENSGDPCAFDYLLFYVVEHMNATSVYYNFRAYRTEITHLGGSVTSSPQLLQTLLDVSCKRSNSTGIVSTMYFGAKNQHRSLIEADLITTYQFRC